MHNGKLLQMSLCNFYLKAILSIFNSHLVTRGVKYVPTDMQDIGLPFLLTRSKLLLFSEINVLQPFNLCFNLQQ